MVEDKVLGFLRRDVHLAASEADEVGKAGVRPDGDAAGFGHADCVAQHRRVAGMKRRGDVGRRDRLHQPCVVANRVGPEGLSDVRVQVDPHPLFWTLNYHEVTKNAKMH